MIRQLILSLTAAGLVATVSLPAIAHGDDRWDRDERIEHRGRHDRHRYLDGRWYRHDGLNRWERWARRNVRREYYRDLRRDWRRYPRQRYFWNGRWHARPWGVWPGYGLDVVDRGRSVAFFGGTAHGSTITYGAQEHRDASCLGCRTGLAGEPRIAVESCFRMERLADGSERRVELPLSACF